MPLYKQKSTTILRTVVVQEACMSGLFITYSHGFRHSPPPPHHACLPF